jgi:DNA modification methylase
MGTKPATVRVHAPKANTKARSRASRFQFAVPQQLFPKEIHADARKIPLPDQSVELVVTSPPYWRKRDYGFSGQVGQESTPQEFVQNLITALREWRRILSRWGSVFLNIGDTYWNRSLAGIPGRLESAACDDGWVLRNRIVWIKEGGMPEPARNRLANRHEYILHLAVSADYYYDMIGYAEKNGNGANPGDVWDIPLRRTFGGHLAPFPDELAERAILLACPTHVCTNCGMPRTRMVERTAELDPQRPQARRAMELAREKGLTDKHIAAIQATGISDAGKALRIQNGTGRNSKEVKRFAAEAKAALGGYFREFTFARKRTVGWTQCKCEAPFRSGVVLDPFMGTGTTLRVASAMGRNAIGVDLAPKTDTDVWGPKRRWPQSLPHNGYLLVHK